MNKRVNFNVVSIALLLTASLLLVACNSAVDTGNSAEQSELLTPPPLVYLDTTRLLISQVEPGSPADAAGLEVNETILSLNGEEIKAAAAFEEQLAAFAPGDTIILEVRAAGDGAVRQVSIELVAHPEQPGQPYLGVIYDQTPNFNFGVQPDSSSDATQSEGLVIPFGASAFVLPFAEDYTFSSPSFAHFAEIPADTFERALIVAEVEANSPASAAGLREGALIAAINGEPITDAAAYMDNLHRVSPGEELSLTVLQPGEQQLDEFNLVLTEHPEETGAPYLGLVLGGLLQFEPFEDPAQHIPADLDTSV